MPDSEEEAISQEAQPSKGMSQDDKQAVSERAAGSAKVVHEVVRLQGDQKLGRPLVSLLFSGFAAGVAGTMKPQIACPKVASPCRASIHASAEPATTWLKSPRAITYVTSTITQNSICASLLAEAFLRMRLPPDVKWSDLVTSLGYSVGFVIVILAGLQLFTESSVTAVLPVATHPTRRNVGRLLRLWTAVFLANMLGTFCVAALMAHGVILGPEQLAAAIEVARTVLSHDFGRTLLLATPAGFLIASIAWILPNARGSLGNILGGTGLFAVVAHGQVRSEIETEG